MSAAISITGRLMTMKSNTARTERLIKGASRGPASHGTAGEAGFDRGLQRGIADAKRQRRRRCYPCNYCGQMDDDNDDDATQTEPESN